ncbi:MAG: NAD-dependent epimerase/dehydratase family protein, partial [Acidimicrobiales bacterium]
TNVLEAMARTGARRLVFSSSVTAYGSWPDNPMSIPEDHPLRSDPKLLYAAHKAEAEKLIEASGVEAVVSRTAPVLGRHVDNYAFRIFAAPVLVAIKGDAPRWQFLHQEDCGRFHAEACRGTRTGVVNLAADDVLGLDEVGDLIGRPVVRVPERAAERALRFGWKYDLIEVDPASLAGLRHMPVADTTRLRKDWGFRCAWTGRETLEDLARVMNRVVYAGKREVPRRRRLAWVRSDIPADLPAADGGPLAAASAPELAGDLDTKIDPRFATFTASNLSEAFPGPMTPLSLELSAHALRGSSSGIAQLLSLPEPLATQFIARAASIFGHRIYGNVSILRAMAQIMPGWTPEDIDHQYLGVPLPERPTTGFSPRSAARALRLAVAIAPAAAGFSAEVDRLVAEAEQLSLSPDLVADLPGERLAARIGLLHDLVVQGWNVACIGNLFAGGLLGVAAKAGGSAAAGLSRGGLADLDSAAAVRGVARLADVLRRPRRRRRRLRPVVRRAACSPRRCR